MQSRFLTAFACAALSCLPTPPAALRAADAPPAADQPAPPPTEPPSLDADHPQCVFLLDYLYSQSAWNGDLIVPYRPDITVRLVDLLTPEEAKAYNAVPPPATVVAGFRAAENEQGTALARAYIAQLRNLAAQLPPADEQLANRLIDGMIRYQLATYRPNRLFAPAEPPPPAPINQGYRLRPAPPDDPAARAPADDPARAAPQAAPPAVAADPGDALNPDELERRRRQVDIARNEAWMRELSAADLARVAAFLANPRPEVAGIGYYDRSLRLYIGRTPVRLSDLFGAPAAFRQQELKAELIWKRQLVVAARGWQKTVTALRNVAAQERAAQMPANLRPGLLAVLQVYHASLAAQQDLQTQYEADLLTLTQPTLTADERAALEKRRDEFPNAMRDLIEKYGHDLEAAWPAALEQALISFYTRTHRLDYVKEHLHPQGKEALEKATTPAAGGGDQF